MAAAGLGLQVACAVLLAHGAEIATTDERGLTAVDYAQDEGHVEIVRLLLAHQRAAFERNTKQLLQSILKLIAYGHDNGDSDGEEKQQRQSDEEITAEVERLLQARADVNVADSETGRTALMLACQHGHEGVARLLLTHGASVNNRNNNSNSNSNSNRNRNSHDGISTSANNSNVRGDTALVLACMGGHEGLVSLLLMHRAQLYSGSGSSGSSSNTTNSNASSSSDGYSDVNMLVALAQSQGHSSLVVKLLAVQSYDIYISNSYTQKKHMN